MTTTTEAMKQALLALDPLEVNAVGVHPEWSDERQRATLKHGRPITLGDCRKGAAAAHALREAIAAEEAQGVELVMTQKEMRVMGSGALIWIDLERLHPSWVSETGRTRQLFTRPAPPASNEALTVKLELMTAERDKMQLELGDLRALRAARPAPPSDHIGDATKLVRERAALIDSHKFVAENGVNQAMRDLARNTADMLAADAQWETESVLIDGIAYTIPSPVAYELLDLHLKLQASDPAQPDNPNKEVDLLHKLGNRLAELLDEDQFSECEDMLLALEAGPWTLKRAQQVAVPQEKDKLCEGLSTGQVMQKAFAWCPTDHPHKLRMQWIADYFIANAPTLPQAERLLMTPEQISDTYKKATGQTLRPCDKHAVETLTREIEAHHEIGVKP